MTKNPNPWIRFDPLPDITPARREQLIQEHRKDIENLQHMEGNALLAEAKARHQHFDELKGNYLERGPDDRDSLTEEICLASDACFVADREVRRRITIERFFA